MAAFFTLITLCIAAFFISAYKVIGVCFWAWNELCLCIALCMGRHFFNFLARFKNTVSPQPRTPAPGDYTFFERKDTTSEPFDKGSDDDYEDANSEIDDDECDDKGEQDCICGRRVWRPNPEIEDEKCGDDELTSEKHRRETVERHLFHTWQVLNWSEEKLKRRNDTIHKLEVKLQSLKTLEVKLLSLKTCDF